jgi:hypothetical protein
MFGGASNIRIINCCLSIIGDDQTWGPMATVNAADQETAKNDSFAEDICPPANMPTFDGASNAKINRGHFSTVARGNTRGAVDLNDPAPQASHQSMFADAENITVEGAVCTIIAGGQFNVETPTKQVKPNSTPHAKVVKSKNGGESN